jgi:hypothetical protein
MRARQHACTALIAKSTAYMARTATKIVTVFLKSPSSMKCPTISLVQPSTIKHAATNRDPITITGRRLPYFDVDLSAITPTIGCIISPESGPAIQTRDVFDFVNPSCNRYGVQSIPNQQLISFHYTQIPTGHLNSPSKPVFPFSPFHNP